MSGILGTFINIFNTDYLNSGLVSEPPNYVEVIQWCFTDEKIYQDDNGNSFFPDKKGDQLRVIHLGSFLLMNGTDNSLSFDDLTAVTIDTFTGTSTPTINVNDIEFTAGTAIYLKLSNGSEYNFEDAPLGSIFITVYDSTENGNNGTINGTIDANTRQRSIEIESDQNENGYNNALSVNQYTNTYYDNLPIPSLDKGAIEMELIPLDVSYYRNTLWESPVDDNDFEAWVNGLGNLRVRMTSTGEGLATADVNSYLNEYLKVRYEWDFSTQICKLYINDVLESTATDYDTKPSSMSYMTLLGNLNTAAEITLLSFKVESEGVVITDIKILEDKSIVNKITDVVYNYSGASPKLSYIPRLEIAENIAKPVKHQTDIYGLTLDQYGRAKYPLQITDSSVGVFNGIDNYIDTGITINNNQRIVVCGNYNSLRTVSPHQMVIGGGTIPSVNEYILGANSTGGWKSRHIDVYVYTGSSDLEEHMFTYDIKNGESKVDNTVIQTFPSTVTGTSTWKIGSNSAGVDNPHFTCRYVEIYENEVLIYRCNFGEGDGSKIFNRVDGSEHLVNGALTNFWGTSDTQIPYNQLNGFDLWENDSTSELLRVPFDVNGDSIKTDGDTLTGYTWLSVHSGSDTKLVNSESTYLQPEAYEPWLASQYFDTNIMYSGTAPIAFEYSDYQPDYETKGIWLTDVFTKNPQYQNHLLYSQPQTGDDLQDAQLFTKIIEPITDEFGAPITDEFGNKIYARKEL